MVRADNVSVMVELHTNNIYYSRSLFLVVAVFVESRPGPGLDLGEAQAGLLLATERQHLLRYLAGAETNTVTLRPETL